MENWRKFVNEAEVGGDQPVPLSQIPSSLAKAAVSSGQQDSAPQDDVAAGGNKTPVAVSKMHPMQKEVVPGKALGMAIGYLLKGKPNLKDAESIAVDDKEQGKIYIMDGHHRWAALTLINPNETTLVTLVKNHTAKDIVTALNLYTKSLGRSGNSGKGDVSQFASLIPKELDNLLTKGIAAIPADPQKNTPEIPAVPPEQIKQALGKIPGANGDAEKGKQLMIQNASKLPTDMHPNAPSRIEMPVINGPQEIEKVVADLVAGKIDFKQPLSKATQNAANYKSARAQGQTPAQIKSSGVIQKESLKKIVRQVIRENLKRR